MLIPTQKYNLKLFGLQYVGNNKCHHNQRVMLKQSYE